MAIDFRHKPLFRSPLLALTEIRWRADNGRRTAENQVAWAEISLQRRGAFIKNHGTSRTVCDPNSAVLIDPDEPYSLSHPAAMDCACTALLLAPTTLAQLVRGPSSYGGSGRRVMPGHDGPIDAATDRLHRRILGRIEQNVEPLQVEELGLALASRVIAAASRLRLGRPPRRRDTARVHAGVVGDVKGLLAAHLGERLSLMQIADSVHVAPNHLCTVFRWQTGFSIHRYLIRLRLAAVRERMADQRDTLADLATEFGFAHQSHLTAAFRREFGATPARLRRGLPAVPSDS